MPGIAYAVPLSYDPSLLDVDLATAAHTPGLPLPISNIPEAVSQTTNHTDPVT